MKNLFFIICLLAMGHTVLSQPASQNNKYIFNGLYINPAYSGYKQDLYVQSFYKSQWTGFSGAPTSYSLAADGLIVNSKVGLGLVFSSDNIGAQSNLSGYGSYAYHLQMDADENSILSFGLGLGFVQNGLDGTKLNAVENGDSNVPVNFQSILLPDSKAGIMYSNEKIYAGISMDNMIAHYFKKDNSINAIVPKPRYYLTGGGLMTLNDDMKLRPSFLLTDTQDGLKSLDLNLFVLLGDRLWIGGTYQTDVTHSFSNSNIASQNTNAVAAMVEIVVNDKIRLGYSFDYSMSALGNNNYGSHEISIGLYFRSKKSSLTSNNRYF
ncbi:type IX secretion system membrane protein PorP/SprF [Mucilaginibacter sp.]|uniref:PorP/SprF family type IX secretion system membrane protein n=1 Tax=Mucilaginibacter sp. TaxID=1882438 RepID=UPI00261BBE53|nr:type IX secretion system membrane protein PorP/SprF [Mucilaginibacter sp.]